jgi:hypothetical protein
VSFGVPQTRRLRVARFGGPALRSRSPWVARLAGLTLALLVTGGLLALTTKTSRGASALSVGAVMFAVAAGWLFRTRRTDLALAIVVAYLGLLDGFLKLMTGSSTVTLGRDALLYAVVLGVLIRRLAQRDSSPLPPLTPWVIGWTALVVVQVLNPSSGPVLHRVASLRQDLEFVPIFFLGYGVVQSRTRLRSLLMLLLAVGAVNGAVGLYQSTLSPDQLASWGSGYSNLVHGTNGAPRTAIGADGKPIVRPPALGGDMGFGGALGIIALPAGFALLLLRRRSQAETMLTGALLSLATIGVISSESRSSIVSGSVALLAFVAMLAASKEARKVLIGFAVFAVVLVVALSSVSSNSLARYKTISPSNLAGTVGQSRAGTTALIPRYLVRFPFGAGIGSSGPAYGSYGSAQNTVDGESEITFLIAEVGVPGLLLMFALQARIIVASVRKLGSMVDTELRIMLVAVLAPLFGFLSNWYVGINTTSSPNAPYMWGAFGILAYWLIRSQGGGHRLGL